MVEMGNSVLPNARIQIKEKKKKGQGQGTPCTAWG